MSLASQVIIWFNYLVFFLLLVFLTVKYFKQADFSRWLKLALGGVLAWRLATFIAQFVLYGWQLKTSLLGKYLFLGNGSFFQNQVKSAVIDLVLQLACAAAVFMLARLVYRWQKKPYLDEFAPYLGALGVLVLNKVNFGLAVVLSLILAIAYQLILTAKGRGGERVALAPFLLFSYMAILLISFLTFLPTI